MADFDFTEIEAAFNADQDEADAIILERWDAHLKKHPVKGKKKNDSKPAAKENPKKKAGE